MSFFRLSNLELDSKIKTLAQKEREVLHEILLHIHEADRRKLYLELAYPNLYAYLTEGCGYSAAAAQRRIDAARLITPVPEVAEKIKNGEISLSQVSYLQKAVREKSKTQKISAEKKQEIIKKLCCKTMPETQTLIAQELDIKIKSSTKATHQKDESVRLELCFSKEQWDELVRAREILSNAVNSNDWAEVFSHLAKKVIQKKEGKKSTSAAEVKNRIPSTQGHLSTATKWKLPQDALEKSKSIPNSIKQIVIKRDQTCQYKDKLTGKVCGSRWNLEIDHVQPRWAGGGNEETNLRVLCQGHNYFLYQRQASIRPKAADLRPPQNRIERIFSGA